MSVVGQYPADVGEDPLGHHREGVARGHRLVGGGDDDGSLRSVVACPPLSNLSGSVPGDAVEHREGCLGVGDGTDLDPERPADLARLDVDVDERGVGDVERVVPVPRTAVGFLEAGSDAEDDVGGETGVVDQLRAPEPGHAQRQRMVVAHTPPCPSGCRPPGVQGDRRNRAVPRSPWRADTAADVHHRALCLGEAGDDGSCRFFVEDGWCSVWTPGRGGRTAQDRSAARRHPSAHRRGPVRVGRLGEQERLVDDFREQLGLVDPPRPLDERPVDLELGTVGVEVDLLVGVSAEEVARMLPAMTTIGMRSRAALATPVAALVRPGLRWLRTTDARPVTRRNRRLRGRRSVRGAR